ncbi:MAG: hypothetical protein J6X78_11650 [Treponema sp.]|nr:hypothetical protein [Treponema sp.]
MTEVNQTLFIPLYGKAKVSRQGIIIKDPINDVGVTTVWGIDDIYSVIEGTQLKFEAEHSLTPENLVNELPSFDRGFFKFLFTGSFYRKIYRLYEISKRA